MNLTEIKAQLEKDLKQADADLEACEIKVRILTAKLKKVNKLINQAQEALK